MILTFFSFGELVPLIRLKELPLCGARESLGSTRVPPQSLAAGPRMKNADSLDVAACVT